MTTATNNEPSAVRDGTILRLIHDRDERGIELLLEAHAASASRVLTSRIPHPDWMLIEECIHDAALSIWERAHRVDLTRGTLGSYFIGIALRLYRRVRCNEREAACSLSRCGLLDQHPAAPEIDPLVRQRHWALADAIRGRIEDMPTNRREVLESDVAEPSLRADTAELADRLGTTRSHIRKIRHDAKRDLEEWFRDHFLPRDEGAA